MRFRTSIGVGAVSVVAALACGGLDDLEGLDDLPKHLDAIEAQIGEALAEPEEPLPDLVLEDVEAIQECTQEAPLVFSHAITPVRADRAIQPLPDGQWLVSTTQAGTTRYERLSTDGLEDLGNAPRTSEPRVAFGEQVWVVGGEANRNDVTVSRVRPLSKSKTTPIRPKDCTACEVQVKAVAAVDGSLWMAGWLKVDAATPATGWLARVDAKGELAEEHRLRPRGHDDADTSIETLEVTAFGLMIAGHHASRPGGRRDTVWLGRFDRKPRWLGSTGLPTAHAAAPAFRIDDTIRVAFPTAADVCGHTVAILEWDQNGKPIGERELVGAGPTEPWKFVVLGDEAVVAVGQGPELSHVVRTTFDGVVSGARFNGLSIHDVAVDDSIRIAGNGTEAIVGTVAF